MYRETLMDQWKNLYSDFAAEYDILQKRGTAVSTLNRWYEARIHRWSSITYAEGILLEQVKCLEFARELQSVLKEFRFTSVENERESPMWIGIVAGIVVGGIAAATLMLLHWGTVKAVISGVLLFVMIAVYFSKRSASNGSQEKRRVRDAYVQQLRDYQTSLTAVCDKYHID